MVRVVRFSLLFFCLAGWGLPTLGVGALNDDFAHTRAESFYQNDRRTNRTMSNASTGSEPVSKLRPEGCAASVTSRIARMNTWHGVVTYTRAE